MDLKQLAKKTESFSGSDLKRECRVFLCPDRPLDGVQIVSELLTKFPIRSVCQRGAGCGEGAGNSAMAATHTGGLINNPDRG